MGWLNPSRETKFSGTYGDRGIFSFPVQLTTSRIGNLTRLIHTLLYVMTLHKYIPGTYIRYTRMVDVSFQSTVGRNIAVRDYKDRDIKPGFAALLYIPAFLSIPPRRSKIILVHYVLYCIILRSF